MAIPNQAGEFRAMSTSSFRATPLHLWVVGVLALLWNLVGAFDFVATQLNLEFYLEGFTEEQLQYFFGFPLWIVICWGLAVWTGVFGSIALLLLSRHAVPLFWISLITMALTAFYNFALSEGLEMMGVAGAIFSAVIALIAIGLLVYSRAMRRRGVLR
jgi:hypothetical protein